MSTRKLFYEVLKFPNFLRSYVLSRSVNCETTRICQVITNNPGSFHLWCKENLLNHQNVSKYYEHGCRSLI